VPHNLRPIHELLGADLADAYQGQACSFIVCLFASWEAVADEYGHRGVDNAVKALAKSIRKSLPDDARAGQLTHDMFGVLVNRGRSASSAVARQIVERVTAVPAEVAKGRTVQLDLIAGVAASDEAPGLPPAQLVFEATWRALFVAPYRKDGVADGSRHR
jgi:GGDEF domain-containing protein